MVMFYIPASLYNFFYPVLDYPWAGSLKPVSNEMLRSQHKGRRGNNLTGLDET